MRQFWQEIAEPWHRISPFINNWLLPVTQLALNLARIRAGSRVLDIAARDGGQTLLAAALCSPTGRVLAIDVSRRLLAHTAGTVRQAGIENVDTALMDCADLAIRSQAFDTVICRLGLEHHPNPLGCLAEARRMLKPGGSMAVIVLSTAERNPFFFLPLRAGRLPPEDPVPARIHAYFRLGARGVLESLLSRAGFRRVETRVIEAPLRFARVGDGRRVLEKFTRMAFISTKAQQPSPQEIQTALYGYQNGRGLVFPGEVVIGIAGL